MPDTEICQNIFASNDSTVAVEAFQTGLFGKRRLILFFENFGGVFRHSTDLSQPWRFEIQVDASSVTCREKSLSAAKRARIIKYSREVALAAADHPQIVFRSTSVAEKPLRGFVMHGDLTIRGVTRAAKANLGLSEMKNDRLQLDIDANICLKDFGIHPPSSSFGLSRISEQVMVHLMLWTNTRNH
jgi:polyisoprenoid-binding protein YceI